MEQNEEKLIIDYALKMAGEAAVAFFQCKVEFRSLGSESIGAVSVVNPGTHEVRVVVHGKCSGNELLADFLCKMTCILEYKTSRILNLWIPKKVRMESPAGIEWFEYVQDQEALKLLGDRKARLKKIEFPRIA